MQRDTKVLMFGWEFPPLMAGGLGVACQELVQALLKENINLQLILPQTTGRESSQGFEIYDANLWRTLYESKKNKAKELTEEEFISPYISAQSPVTITNLAPKAIQEIIKRAKNKTFHELNSDASNVYAGDLFHRVYEYGQTAKSIAQNLDFDVIHCHDWMTVQAGMLAKHVSQKPLILHIHCTEYDRCPQTGNEHIHRLEKQGCELADKIITVSNLTKNILIEKYNINPLKIEVVHNGVEQNVYYPEPKLLRKDSPKILFLGRVTYQKGPNYFLEAAAKVLKHRDDAEFIMAGTGDMLDYLKGRAYELGIQDSIDFLGAVPPDKVKDVYRHSDAFVLSSVSEPFGLTVLEAISQRLPAIITKQSGAAEVLKNVLKYDFWDTDKLAEYILSVINYEDLAMSLKEKSIEDLKDIQWGKASKKIKEIYSWFN